MDTENEKLKAQEKRMIEIGLRQIEEGKMLSNKEVRKKTDDFLLKQRSDNQ